MTDYDLGIIQGHLRNLLLEPGNVRIVMVRVHPAIVGIVRFDDPLELLRVFHLLASAGAGNVSGDEELLGFGEVGLGLGLVPGGPLPRGAVVD